VTPPASWRAIYERLFEKGPDSFSRPERETIRDAIEEAWNAGAAASPSREAPAPTPEPSGDLAKIEAMLDSVCERYAAGRQADGEVEAASLLSEIQRVVEAAHAAAAAVDTAAMYLDERDAALASKAEAERERDAARALAEERSREWHRAARERDEAARLSRPEAPESDRYEEGRRETAEKAAQIAESYDPEWPSAAAADIRSLSSGPALAPWYEADGSTVMLPAPEVERRRKLAAKVLEVARRVVRDLYYADGPGGALLNELRARFSALDAASPPPPTPGPEKE
jgi:hypothetical protein